MADRVAARFPLHLVALGVMLYSSGPVLARSTETTGILLSFWRLWFGFAILMVGVAASAATGRFLGRRRGFELAVLAGVAFAANQVLFFTAIKRTTVVDTTLMGTLSPIVVAALAVPLFGERPAPAFRLWSLVAMAGAAYVVIGGSAGPSGDLAGMLMALASMACFSVFFLLSKMTRDDVAVVGFLAVVMGTAAVVVSVLVVVTDQGPLTVGQADLWRALAMAVVPGTLGHVVMTWPLRHVPANVPPLMRLAGPVLAGSMAWLILGEGFTWVHLIGGAVITVGLAGAISSKAGQDLLADARNRVSPS